MHMFVWFRACSRAEYQAIVIECVISLPLGRVIDGSIKAIVQIAWQEYAKKLIKVSLKETKV